MRSIVQPIITGLKRWTVLLMGAVGASLGASVLTLTATTIILRFLPIERAGYFALWLALLQTIMLIGAWGQPTLTLRLYSNQPKGHYNWRRDIQNVFVITAPVVTVLSLACGYIYQMPALHIVLLTLAAAGTVLVSCIAPMLTAQGLYTWGSLLLRLPNALMIVPALAMLALPSVEWLPVLLTAQVAFVTCSLVIGVLILNRRGQHGAQAPTFRQRRYGLVFLVSASSTIVPDQLFIAISGMLVSHEALAGLAALLTLFGPAQLLQNILTNVLITEFARRTNIHFKRMIAGLWVLGAALVIGAVLVMPLILHVVYGGRYDAAAYLVIWVAIANALDLTETVPRSYLMGKAAVRWLNRLIASQALISLPGIWIGAYLIGTWGLMGTVLATIIIFICRNVISYALWSRAR